MIKRSEDARVQRALAGDGRNLGKSRQRKWQRILMQLRIIREIPHTNPQLFEAGPAIRELESYLPFRKELSDGTKIISENGSVVDNAEKLSKREARIDATPPLETAAGTSGKKSGEKKQVRIQLPGQPRNEPETNAVTQEVVPEVMEVTTPSLEVTTPSLQNTTNQNVGETSQSLHQPPAAPVATTTSHTNPSNMATAIQQRRTELWMKSTRTTEEEKELMGLLISYRDELQGTRFLNPQQTTDLEWLTANPPENTLARLRRSSEWDAFMERNGVYRRALSGGMVPGHLFQNLQEYEVNSNELMKGRLRIDSKGSVVPKYFGPKPNIPLPAENRPLVPEEIETRKNWLFGLNPKARAARYRVVEHMVHLKIELTEEEKLDRMYLKTLFMPGNKD